MFSVHIFDTSKKFLTNPNRDYTWDFSIWRASFPILIHNTYTPWSVIHRNTKALLFAFTLQSHSPDLGRNKAVCVPIAHPHESVPVYISRGILHWPFRHAVVRLYIEPSHALYHEVRRYSLFGRVWNIEFQCFLVGF